MLPAPNRDRISLADVLPSCLAAVTGQANRLGLPPVSRAVVVLADGLGAAALKERGGHARTLAAQLASGIISSGFPTTTAAALATLTTGRLPGEHGLVGYTVLDAANDRVVNQLSGWDDRLDPSTWQRRPTVFELAPGIASIAVGPERYRSSGFSAAILRGAEYLAAASIPDRFDRALDWMRSSTSPAILYLYLPELDMAAHAHGWQSSRWTEKLEQVDAAVRDFAPALRPTEGMLVTADHGVLDVPAHGHVLIDEDRALVEGIRFVAGEPRCLQLYFEPDLSPQAREHAVEAWRAAESGRAWVASKREAIAAGWFGPVDPEVEPRIGDLLVAARKNIAYYDGRSASSGARSMVGQHGSWSPAEVQVPLLRFGAFSR